MNIDFLDKKEQIALKLQGIYSHAGYSKYKMNRFEEYSFYMVNEEFLEDSRIITFYDPQGKLLALKPDITMSVIKSCLKKPDETRKMYYNESVFRIPRDSSDFKEIHQLGVECIGDVTLAQTMEVLGLAKESLAAIGSQYMMCISNMGLISQIFQDLSLNLEQKSKITGYMKQKNIHDLERYMGEEGLFGGEILTGLLSLPQDTTQAMAQLKALLRGARYAPILVDLEELVAGLPAVVEGARIQLDFSYITNLEYYNGTCFIGYIQGVASPVVTGGRYDNLVEKMGLTGKSALGFAVNLSAVEQFLGRGQKEALC